ncbi:MAG: 2-hydroxychromene-2-carboxylate isomerase [Hyphomicrobiaceae bacterium]|jgi:2-hydroxychromene-2-carboxylate isomerase
MSRQEKIRRRVSPWVTRVLTSPRLRDMRRTLAEKRRRLRGAPRKISYFHQADDPYSHLAVQTLATLLKRYEIELDVFLVGPHPDDAAPQPELLEAFARKDAGDIAQPYGLEFPHIDHQPDLGLVATANRILTAAIQNGTFVEIAPQVGRALFTEDSPAMDALAARTEPATQAAAETAIRQGSERRKKLGHYSGAMFYDEPEWYWGVDRLHHLETRLDNDGARRSGEPGTPIVVRPTAITEPDTPANQPRLTVEFFASLRSPYTYIVMERILDLAKRFPIDVVQRPVLPMVMRGLAVPLTKQLYIQFDTKREAELAGVDFGHVCDPVGEPVERGFSLFNWARNEGRAPEFLLEFTRAAFADGIDTGSEKGLRQVVERAGLDWNEAQVDLDGWREELEQNRLALFDLGLWGVPSFHIIGDERDPDFCTWGQDRVWLVEQEIARRVARDSGP